MDDSILARIGNTPLVRFQHLGPVWGKCEHLNPAGSVKDRIALWILNDAEQSGRLQPGATLVEATAGNTGMGLALVAASRGYRLVCVMPEKMSADKRRSLAVLGAEVIITDNAPPDDERNFQNVARRLARENGWFLTDQFCNPANIRAHYETTGPELWEQTEGRIAAFVAGVGTGGTLTGVGRYLKERNPAVRVVLADPLGSALAHYVQHGTYAGDGPYLVEGIGSSRCPENFDPSVVDETITVSDEDSLETARLLMRREGLLVGGSAGTATAAALQLARRQSWEGPVVALLADSWDRYWSKPWLEL